MRWTPAAAPLVVSAVTIALTAGRPVLAVLVALAVATSFLAGRVRLPLDRASSRLASLVLVLVVIAYVRGASPAALDGAHLGSFALGVALAAQLVGTLRVWVRGGRGGDPWTLTSGLLAVMACGSARLGLPYVLLALAQLAVGLWALRAGDAARESLLRAPRRVVGVAALTLGIAGGVATGVALLAPVANAWMARRFQALYGQRMQARVGFSSSVRIGHMTDMLQSDEAVLRVRGDHVDYLRGAVLDQYSGGRWWRDARTEGVGLVTRGRLEGSSSEVRALRDLRALAFLPLEAEALGAPSGQLRTDVFGVARRSSDDDRVWVRPGRTKALAIAEPTPNDLALPSGIRPILAPIATRWAAGAMSADEVLDGIARHLEAEHAYALVTYPAGEVAGDPVVDFLLRKRPGHCEYFASSLALLARSVDIPARVVTGYRVTERHGGQGRWGHWVVRQKNAHAWVEAWGPDGRWTLHDPTPLVELPHQRPHDAGEEAAKGESLAFAWEELQDWLAERSAVELAMAAVAGLALFVGQRWWKARRGERLSAPGVLAFSRAPSAFLRLERLLARRGLGRARGETLEGWAARLPDPELRAALMRYAAARYAGATEEASEASLAGVLSSRWRSRP